MILKMFSFKIVLKIFQFYTCRMITRTIVCLSLAALVSCQGDASDPKETNYKKFIGEQEYVSYLDTG